MASFETHLTVATLGVGVLTTPLLASGMINTYEAVLLLSLGVIGGMLPDIDSDNSIPVKIAYKVISLIVPLIIVFKFSVKLALLKIIGLWIIFSLILYMIFTHGFLKMTVHRGIFHTIGMGVLAGELLALFFIDALHINHTLAIFSGVYLTIGYIIHLILDEVYSVDLHNSRLKRSFGTALKIYDKNNLSGSLIVNALAIGIFFLLPNIIEELKFLLRLVENIKIY